MITDYLTQRQRAPVPMPAAPRRGRSGGGYDYASPATLAPGLETELARYPGTTGDSTLRRDRGPWYPRVMVRPPGDGWVNWTAAGPARPELAMRSTTWRPEAGASRSRFPVVPSAPTGGMHTMVTPGVARTVPRYVQTQQMTAARPDRLSAARYAGQSYSQTTIPQGGGR